MLYANLLLNVLYHIEIEMKIRESCLQTGNFIYKPGISLTKQDFHLQRGSLGLQRGFSGYYLPFDEKLSMLDITSEKYLDDLKKIMENINTRLKQDVNYSQEVVVLKDLISRIADQFLFNEKYGLNTFLSSRLISICEKSSAYK